MNITIECEDGRVFSMLSSSFRILEISFHYKGCATVLVQGSHMGKIMPCESIECPTDNWVGSTHEFRNQFGGAAVFGKFVDTKLEV